MNALLGVVSALATGTVLIAVPAVCGFGLGVRWANARRTRWRARARRLQAERDALLDTIAQNTARTDRMTADLAAINERLRRLHGRGGNPADADRLFVDDPAKYTGLRIVRPEGSRP